MAIITLGELVTGIRGKTGGLVYSANRAGPYVKAWNRPPNPRAEKQQAARAQLAAQGGLWAALDQSQRDDWDALAVTDPEPVYNSLGELVSQSGYTYFTKCNIRRAAALLDPLTDAPTGDQALRPPLMSITTFEVDTDPSESLVLEWDTTFALAGAYAAVYAAATVSAARQPATSDFRFIGLATALDGYADLSIQLFAALGTLIPGWQVTVWLRQRIESGLESINEPGIATVT